MKLLSYSAYALWAARLLADSKEPIGKAQLAERLGIADGFMQQVLRCLQMAGLVKAGRGAVAGYSLVKPARKMTQLEVIEATLDRPVGGEEEGEPPLLHTARQRVRAMIVPALAVPLLDWPLPPPLPAS